MYATTWMNESFKHYAKGKQPETKVIYCIIVWWHLYEMSRVSKTTENRLVVALNWGRWGVGMFFFPR